MLTVLLSAYACLPNRGSEEGNGWNYATRLSQRGIRVHCFTRATARDAIEAALADGQHPNLTVHYVPVPAWLERAYGNLLGMYAHYIYWQWQAASLAKQVDRQVNADLVHHATYSSLQLGSFMYRVGKPFVFGPVGGGQRVPPAFKKYLGGYYSRERMRDAVSWVLERLNPGVFRTLKQADTVLISNADTVRMASKYRKDRPVERMLDASLGDGFITDGQTEHAMNPPVLHLLWVGRLLPRKGLELTIEAFSRVDPALPIRLTIVGGDGEISPLVPGYLEKYGVADRVDWVGQVPYADVQRYYRQSDVFFFTSLRDSGPAQLFEAMAFSLPIVTLDLHGQGEIIDGTNGIKVAVITPEETVAELAKAVERLYHNPRERLEMGRRGYDFAVSRSWDKKIDRFCNQIYPALSRSALAKPA